MSEINEKLTSGDLKKAIGEAIEILKNTHDENKEWEELLKKWTEVCLHEEDQIDINKWFEKHAATLPANVKIEIKTGDYVLSLNTQKVELAPLQVTLVKMARFGAHISPENWDKTQHYFNDIVESYHHELTPEHGQGIAALITSYRLLGFFLYFTQKMLRAVISQKQAKP